MDKKQILPALFEGATHRLNGVEPVKAVQWVKDGDHPLVQRYPIERRDYKGLLVAGPKDKLALRFGEWIIEDAVGRFWVEASQELPAKYEPVAPVSVAATVANVIALIVAAIYALFGEPSSMPLLIGVTHLMYYSSIKGQWDGTANSVFDLDTDTIKVSAHTNTYAPNQDTHDFFDDLTNEVAGTNYVAGGATLASPTVTRSSGTVTFDANDVVWTQSAAGFSTARKFVVYRSTGAAATSRLFSVVTADADVGNVTGDLTIQWSASGIATWTTT
jgi:hypothetical protein